MPEDTMKTCNPTNSD